MAHACPLAKGGARADRLTRRAEFLLVAGKGRKAPSPGLVLQALRRDDEAPARLGFTVTKKVGNAVVRNRTKRRLRAAAREVLSEAPVIGVDLVLIGRDGTRGRKFTALKEDLRQALDRVGVTTQNSSPPDLIRGSTPTPRGPSAPWTPGSSPGVTNDRGRFMETPL